MEKAAFIPGCLDATEDGEWNGRTIHRLNRSHLWVYDDIRIEMPEGFENDQSSVPRLPVVYWIWGDRAHMEGSLHDFCYRKDAFLYRIRGQVTSREAISRDQADRLFRIAMIGRGRSWGIYQPMYLAVRMAGGSSFHRFNVMDRLPRDE